MKKKFFIGIALGMLLSSVLPAHSAMIDILPGYYFGQVTAANDPASGNMWSGIGQSFITQDSHIKFGFYIMGMYDNSTDTESVLFSLYSGDGVSSSNLLNQKIVDFAPKSAFAEADFSSVNLTVGNSYTVVASLPSYSLPTSSDSVSDPYTGGLYSNVIIYFSSNPDNQNPYAYGKYYITGGPYEYPDPDWDLAFRVTPTDDNNTGAPVPEPATMLLMGTGLAGLVCARRKKK